MKNKTILITGGTRFLLSEESSYIVGTDVLIDGGVRFG